MIWRHFRNHRICNMCWPRKSDVILLGAPRGTWNPAFTQIFHTNYTQRLQEIHAYAKFTQLRWMPDWTFTQLFPSNSRFHAQSHQAFTFGGGAKTSLDSKQPYKLLNVWNILRPLAYKVVALKKENNVWYILKLVRLHAFL